MDIYTLSLKKAKEINNKSGIEYCLMSLGISYESRGEYDEALKYYFQSLNISKELDNDESALDIMNRLQLEVSTDENELDSIIDIVVKNFPNEFNRLNNGEEKLIKFFI